MKRGLTVACLVIAGCTWFVSTSLSAQSTSTRQQGSSCFPNPTQARRGQIPVYIWLYATSGGKMDLTYGTVVRWYRSVRRHGRVVHAVIGTTRVGSGCLTTYVVSRKFAPQWGCVNTRHGWSAVGGPCRTVLREQYGDRFVAFQVAYP